MMLWWIIDYWPVAEWLYLTAEYVLTVELPGMLT